MNLKQFTVLILRIQVLWCLLNAVHTGTYLPASFRRLHMLSPGSVLYSDYKMELFTQLFRIAIDLGVALALVSYCQPLVKILTKGLDEETAA